MDPSQTSDTEETSMTKKKKERGPTVCQQMSKMKEREKYTIQFVDGQLVGDFSEKFSSYYSIIVRDNQLLPVNYPSWPLVNKEFKEAVWT